MTSRSLIRDKCIFYKIFLHRKYENYAWLKEILYTLFKYNLRPLVLMTK